MSAFGRTLEQHLISYRVVVSFSASEVTTLWHYTNLFIIIIFLAHQHKAAGRKTRLDIQNCGCNSNLLCYHGVVERNRISSLQSHGKALEKECCLPGVFCDSGDTPAKANLLCELIIIIIVVRCAGRSKQYARA